MTVKNCISEASGAPVEEADPGLDQQNIDVEDTEVARKMRQHVEDLLDSALQESFPASDPPSIAMPREWRGHTK